MTNSELKIEKIYLAQVAIFKKLSKIEDKLNNRSTLKSDSAYSDDLASEIQKIKESLPKPDNGVEIR